MAHGAPPLGQAPARRRWPVTLAIAVVAVICLIAAFSAGSRAHAELTRKPTAAELSAAAALGVASRWQRWTAGQIFPARLSYTTDLLNQETAQRAGIAPADNCVAALDAPVAATARRYGCRAALRASYVDQLGGVVYTVGVLAFPSPARGGSLHRPLSGRPEPGQRPARAGAAGDRRGGLQRFGPAGGVGAAERALRGAHRGGLHGRRPAAATGERRASIFDPATQLANQIGMPLTEPVTVRCATPEWSC